MATLLNVPLVNGLQKTLDAQLDAGTTASVTLNNTTNIQAPGVFVVNRIDANGNEKSASDREFIKFTGVSGKTLTGLTRNADGGSSDQDHAVGSIVEFVADVIWAQALVDVIETEHNSDGTHGNVTTASLSTDTINEKTTNSGVTVDGVLLKDGVVSSKQPSAELQISSGTSVSNSTETVISFDAEGWDTHGFHDNSVNNSRITIPSGLGGRYLIVVRVIWAGSGSGARLVRLVADGTTNTKFDFVNDGNAGVFGVDTKNHSMIMELSAGSYYELKLWQDSGGDLAVYELLWEIYKLP